jgi:hypothetical protein
MARPFGSTRDWAIAWRGIASVSVSVGVANVAWFLLWPTGLSWGCPVIFQGAGLGSAAQAAPFVMGPFKPSTRCPGGRPAAATVSRATSPASVRYRFPVLRRGAEGPFRSISTLSITRPTRSSVPVYRSVRAPAWAGQRAGSLRSRISASISMWAVEHARASMRGALGVMSLRTPPIRWATSMARLRTTCRTTRIQTIKICLRNSAPSAPARRARLAASQHSLSHPPLVQCAFLPLVGRPEPAVAGMIYPWGRFLRICCTPGKLTSRGP